MNKDHRLRPGEVFADAYRVDTVIAQGTMGSVYGVTERGGARRALKIMKPDLLEDPTFVQRFAQEAGIASRIRSPHVVATYASGIDAETRLPWLAMELLEGRTLDVYLKEIPLPPPPIGRAILDQLFGAAAAAHAANIVHRDLKPENVFLAGPADRPFVKILDFGIAKIVKEATHSGTVAGLGTPLWTAPEQSREGQIIRPSADVWALGLITFRVLAGRPYWKTMNDESSSPFDVAVELIKAPLAAASARLVELGTPLPLPPGFDAWFGRCVVREPELRFATAAEAHDALVLLFDPRPPPAPADAIATRAPGEQRSGAARSPVAKAVAILAAVLTLGGVIAVVWHVFRS